MQTTQTLTSSQKAFEESKQYIPGGVNSPVRSFNAVGGHPRFIRKGQGAYIYDIDGNSYMDYCASWGPLILGHAPAAVVNAVQTAVADGSTFGAPTELETQLAKMIVNSVPSIDKVRFVNSGTEAVMSAIRLARGYTGRKKIVKFNGCYHGHADHLLVSAGSGVATFKEASSAGVPEEFIKQTISIPFNDEAALKEVFDSYGPEIAALIVEPIPANMGVILPRPGFHQTLRDITTANKALLIFDEVITGFRLGLSGAQGELGITPDLTTFGKIIGGGLPVGAYGGKQEIMGLLAPNGPVYQAGTLSGNPLAMAAGIAVLKTLQTPGFYIQLNATTAKFIQALKEVIKNKPLQINTIGSMFTLFFSESQPSNCDDVKQCNFGSFSKFHQELLANGVYFAPSQYEANFVSAAHTEVELEKTLKIIQGVL